MGIGVRGMREREREGWLAETGPLRKMRAPEWIRNGGVYGISVSGYLGSQEADLKTRVVSINRFSRYRHNYVEQNVG